MKKLNDLSQLKELQQKERKECLAQLLKEWSTPNPYLFGKVIRVENKKLLLVDLKNLNGDRVKYPNGKKVTFHIPKDNSLLVNKSYKIKFKLASNQLREKFGNKYFIEIDTKFKLKEVENSKDKAKAYIDKLRRGYEKIEEHQMKGFLGSVELLTTEINKKSETFIYELIQNADDNADSKNNNIVNIKFTFADHYLVVTHDGLPFQKENVEALCSVNFGNKKKDFKKTGFKGIGFKSLFKFSNRVSIYSGDYFFKFDENYYKDKKRTMVWQIVPIWDTPSRQLKARLGKLLNSPVSIIIRPKKGDVELVGIENTFQEVFKNDNRVLLFLRNVKSLEFQGYKDHFKSEIKEEEWLLSNLGEISIPDRILDYLSKTNDKKIPDKFKGVKKTTLSFATGAKDKVVLPLDNAKIYAYLPTDWDFGFKFLINGDFIPDGSRERLFDDIEWNLFLMEQAGFKFVVWIAQLIKENQNTSAYKLIPDLEYLISIEKDRSKIIFLNKFKEGFDNAIDEVEFILCENGRLALLSDIIIDQTGISALIGTEKFKTIFNIEKDTLNPEIKKTNWIQKLIKQKEFEGLFTWDNLISKFPTIVNELYKPIFNSNFLNLVVTSNKLDLFKITPFILNNKNELTLLDSVYSSVPEEHVEIISWLGGRWLNNEILVHLNENTLKNFKTFKGVEFIQSNLVGNIKNVNNCIKTLDISSQIFSFINKYSEELPSKTIEELKSLYFIDYNESIINGFNNQTNYLPSESLTKIVDKKCFPEGHFKIVNPKYTEQNLRTLLKDKFNVIDFEAIDYGTFLLTEVPNDLAKINKHIETLEESSFIKATSYLFQLFTLSKASLNEKQLEEVILAYSKILVLSKSGEKVSLNTCFISGDYSGSSDVEDLIEEFGMEVYFISEKYLDLTEFSKSKWNRLFVELGCKSDHLNFIKDTLLISIHNLERDKLIKATRLIFENRNSLKDEIAKIKNFPIATSKTICKASEALYNKKMLQIEPLVLELWELCEIENEISNDYFETATSTWIDFFNSIGVVEPTSEYLIEQCVDYVVSTPTETEEKHINLFELLLKLNKAELIDKKNFSALKSFKLLDGNNEYKSAQDLFFGTNYKPKIDFGNILDNDINLVSEKYLELKENESEIKWLLIKIGVLENFNVVFSKKVYRADLPEWYLDYIDDSKSSIKSNATSFGSQHYVGKTKKYNFIPHLDLISKWEINQLFWKEVLLNESFRAYAFDTLDYNYNYGPVSIKGYLSVYLDTSPSIPNLNNVLSLGSKLYSNEFKGVLKNNELICALDLSEILIGENDLEKLLGIKKELDFDALLIIFEQEESFNFLKKYKILKVLKDLIEAGLSNEQLKKLKNFLHTSKLFNQQGDWIPIENLYTPEKDFELGISKNKWILHSDMVFLVDLANITLLKESDFQFTKDSYQEVTHFKNRLFNRLKYVAFTVANENWEENEKEFIELIKDYRFYQCKKIIMQFHNDEVLIAKNDYDYIIHEGDFYFRGAWNGMRAADMFIELARLIGLKKVNEQTFREVLLLDSEEEVIDYIEELGFEIPKNWQKPIVETKEKSMLGSQTKVDENNYEEQESSESVNESEESYEEVNDENDSNYENTKNEERLVVYSEEEESLLVKLFGDTLSTSEKSDSNLEAHIKALNYYKNNGCDISEAEKNFQENFPDRYLFPIIKNDIKYKVMCRSALKGLLYFGAYAYQELSNDNTELYVLIGEKNTDCIVAKNQSELKSDGADYWLLRRDIDENNINLTNIIEAEEEKDKLQILFSVKKSIFSNMFLDWESKKDNSFEGNYGNEEI